VGTTYSHSRLSCFEQCPHRYKLRYIDEVEIEERQGIEAFTGTLVHLSLQHLHEEAAQGKVLSSGELVSNNALVRISKAMSDATVLIAGLVGALVVFNTMLMSINERTKEVGILLALGWQRSTVAKLIITESVLITVGGGVMGIGAGLGMTTILEHLDLLRGKIEAVVSAPFLLAALALALLLGVVGGLYPAFKAARLLPAQALRYE
jgi:putative ABC transport system permease protein